jgi:hypothetical protein
MRNRSISAHAMSTLGRTLEAMLGSSLCVARKRGFSRPLTLYDG